MRRFLLRVIGLSAGIVAAATMWVVMTLPPAAKHPIGQSAPGAFVSGAYHIHSNRSDGSGSVDAIAEAASRAGLQFVILTDHGDGTRLPDPPAYRHGVLCIDAVEINSAAGHIVALNLTEASPYPLAGEGRDVIEDIHRMGGWAIAAHPDSPRGDLRWRGGGTTVDGIEWLNVDTEWRRSAGLALAGAVGRTLFRGPETIASLFKSSGGGLERWDAMLRAHQTFALAALDAHARMGEDVDAGQPSSRSFALSLPPYETMFRTLTQTVQLDRPMSSDAAADAGAVLQAIKAGHSFSVVRGYVDAPAAFEFSATSESGRVDLGGATESATAVTMRAAVPAAIGGRVVLLKDGREIAAGESRVELPNAAPGVYRVEVRQTGRGVPWIVSNAIRIGAVPDVRPAPAPVLKQAATAIAPEAWTIEKHTTTQASAAVAGGEVKLHYQLGGGAPAGQFVALASQASGDAALEAIVFTASASRPMRLSVQIRVPGGANGQRWRRSVYLDQTPREIRVRLADLEPADRRSPLRPISTRVQSILLVIDTVNARPGDSGELVIRDAGYIRRQ